MLLNSKFIILSALFLYGCSAGSNGDSSVIDSGDQQKPIVDEEPSVINEGYEKQHLYAGSVTSQQQVTLNQLIIEPKIKPSKTRPRLYGANDQWFAKLELINNADENCTQGGKSSGLGVVNNYTAMWQNLMLGGIQCKNNIPKRLEEHRDANQYISGKVLVDRPAQDQLRLRLINLIRREYYCRDRDYSCQFQLEDFKSFAKIFIDTEISRLKQAPRVHLAPLFASQMDVTDEFRFIQYWHKSNDPRFMVLEAAPAFKFWTLVIDVLGHDSEILSVEDKALIEKELRHEIDSYILQAKNKHWSLFNGNNWTVMLNSAALHWALLYYYEQPEKAKEVIKYVVETNWFHRDYYLDDGGYLEGSSYAQATSYPYLLTQHFLLMAAFNQPFHSFKWLNGKKIAEWTLDNIMSDNRQINFGDGWDKIGFSTAMALELLHPNAMLNLGEKDIVDSCLVKRFFTHTYFDLALYDPWLTSDVLFKDWVAVVESCQEHQKTIELNSYPDMGFVKLRSIDASATSSLATTESPYYSQSSLQELALTATDTATPHREMDVGSLLWTAYGSRLINDFGYGRIIRNYYEYDIYETVGYNGAGYDNHLDHMLGGSTLVVPAAFKNYVDTTNNENRERFQYQGQAHGQSGKIEIKTLAGRDAIRLDASDVYSKGAAGALGYRPAVPGYLSRFIRWMVPIATLKDGKEVYNATILVDIIEAKDNTTHKAEEYFYSNIDSVTDLQATKGNCTGVPSETIEIEHSDSAPNYYQLRPKCNVLKKSDEVEVVAQVNGFSLSGGSFTKALPIQLTSLPEKFTSDALRLDDGIATLSLRNQLGKRTARRLMRWQPNKAVEKDIRVFVLQSQNNQRELISTSIAKGNCDFYACINVSYGDQLHQLRFRQSSNRAISLEEIKEL